MNVFKTDNGVWINKQKRQAIHYILYKSVKWWNEINKNSILSNDISILKFLHIIYLVSTVKIKKDEKSILLDEIFTEFYAQPYGAIEVEVKNYLKYSNLITNHTANIEKEPQIEDNLKNIINLQFLILKEINHNIINYPAFDSIEMSKRNYSYSLIYNKALKNNSYSEKINTCLIKNEERNYSR